ncbi:MAG: mechanosensitive ion channel [Thermostichus sp. BF3_bins_97]
MCRFLHRRLRWLWMGLLLLLLVGKLGGIPAWSQPGGLRAEADPAPIVLDGQVLFQVQASGQFNAQERADFINLLLQDVITGPDPVEVQIEERNNLPTLLLDGRYLLTVTDQDVEENQSPQAQAEEWATILEEALAEAQSQRSLEYLQNAGIRAGIVVVAAILLHGVLGWLQRRWGRESGSLQPLLALVVFLSRLGLWLVTVAYVIRLFPLTRQWLYRVSVALNWGLDPDPVPRLPIFLGLVTLSLLVGYSTPSILIALCRRFSSTKAFTILERILAPLREAQQMAGTILLLHASLNILRPYSTLFGLLRPWLDLALIVSLAWLLSRGFRQVVRLYGIDLIRKFGLEIDEFVLVIETVVNAVIIIFSVFIFAQTQQFNLVGLLTSLGIGGLAVAFAAQKIIEQFLSTIVLYLDRPFGPGDYIRMANGQIGRIESSGLRSTKIRTAAKSTLMIVPNSNLVNAEIENLTMAKKVMVLLYLDFLKPLEDQDAALVKQVISEETNSLFGIDPGSTQISLLQNAEERITRARITFFILGSSENSIQLRKRLLELANEKISKKLAKFGIQFFLQDPTIYVESPVTI